MHKYYKTFSGFVLAAALGVTVVGGTAHFARAAAGPQDAPAKKEKAYKDNAEYDAYNEVIKASNPMDAKKLLAALDSWSQRYPTTDYKDERTYYYLQAYAGNQQYAKVLDTAAPLIASGISGLKSTFTVPYFVLQTLFLASANATQLAASGTPTPAELDTGLKAAQMLQEYGKEYFAADKRPAATPADQWATGLKLVNDTVNNTFLEIALYPGSSILKADPKDPATCAKAEAAFGKVLQDHPESGRVSVLMANVMRCQQSATPEKAQQAIYEYARAAGDPVGAPWGLDDANQKQIATYLTQAYTQIHGSDEGLADLKALAAKSPLPPDGFKIKTKTEIALEKQEEFKSKNPQLAMWMGLKASLADTNGQQYFEGSLKDADVHGEGAKALKGTVMGMELKGKAVTCRPDELLIAVPLPDQQGAPVPEITLKFETPLAGAPAVGSEIQWDGVPTAFTKEPFMLTMETEKAKVEGLTLTPCAAPPPKKAATPPAATKGGTTTTPPTKKK